MDAQQFLEEFGHIASAPEGIQRLRAMIYNLAITGDIAEQLPEDGNAQALLDEIERERQRRIKAKEFKRTAKLESLPLDIPTNIKLPESWKWTRLLDIGEISPRNEAKNDALASFIPMSGISQLHKGNLQPEIQNWGDIKKGFTHFANGDVVVAKITPCFENGKAAVISELDNEQGIGAGTTELHVFRPIHPEIHPGYIYIFLRSPFFAVKGEQSMTGTAGQKRLPTEYFATRALPLPPFLEQVRIVAKVDDLMALCDKLEVLQQAQDRLRSSTLKAVVGAFDHIESNNELSECWNRLSRELPNLIDKASHVEEVRNLIFELGSQGKLSEQRKTDTSSSLLIKEVLAARSKRVADGDMKVKKASATDIVDLEIPMSAHWVKAQVDELFQFIDYRGKTPNKTSTGVVLVTAKNVRPRKIEQEPVEYISGHNYSEWMTRGFPKQGDLLITTEAPLGNVARIEVEPTFALAQRVINLQPFGEINTKFYMYFMSSPSFQALLWENASGMTARGIKAAKLKQLPLSVPPREEQDRIVQSIEKLLLLCDELESQLNAAKLVAKQLANAAIESITGIGTVEGDELKVPKTELISKLRLGKSPDIKEQAPLASILARQNNEMSAKDLWQRYGGEIDVFYSQLKLEVNNGWIHEPAVAEMREIEVN